MENQELQLAPADSPDNETLKRADAPAIWQDFRAKFETLKTTAETLVVKDAKDIATMRLAADTRKALKAVRCAVENKRVELVEGLKKNTKKIDNAAKEIRLLIEPLEERLREQEEFAIRAAAARKEELAKDRSAKIAAWCNPSAFQLGEMSEEDFATLHDGMKSAHEARVAAAKKAKEEAEAKANAEAEERERQRAENERLKKEAAEREAEMKAEREKAEHERQEAAEAARKERKEKEELQRKFEAEQKKQAEERAAREKAEAELRAKVAAEEAKAAEERRERAALAKAPDREKLMAFAGQVRSLEFPALTTEDGNALLSEITDQAAKFVAWIEKKAAAL